MGTSRRNSILDAFLSFGFSILNSDFFFVSFVSFVPLW